MLVEETPVPTLILAATADEKACLIVPPRTFSAGRVLRSLSSSGPERRFRLTRLGQRGADFERVAFEAERVVRRRARRDRLAEADRRDRPRQGQLGTS